MKIKKHKYKLLFIPIVSILAGSLFMLSNLDTVEAANNNTCSAEYFMREYIDKIFVDYYVDGNETVATIINTGDRPLFYSYYADEQANEVAGGVLQPNFPVGVGVKTSGVVKFYLYAGINDECDAFSGQEIGKITLNADGLMANPLYNDSICVNYRNKWGNNETMKNAVPCCFSETTYSSYSREQVQEWINTAERFQSMINSSQSQGGDVGDVSGYTSVDDVTKTDKLVCDAFSTDNYETVHKYYHTDTSTSNNCKVTCTEKIEVNFSDPVATQAGMCFQYLIEIKSKVSCTSSYSGKLPTRKSVCYPTPTCKSGNESYDAGGPSDDFDECVLNCDGGKYTQKCIDSCYSKVYEDKGTKKTDSTTFTNEELQAISPFAKPADSFMEATKMATTCITPLNVINDLATAEELFNQKQLDPGGYYKGTTWIQSGECPSVLGPYYYRSLEQTERTVQMIDGTYSYSGGTKGYVADGNGILREKYSSDETCNDSCSWNKTCPSGTVLTEGQAQAEYEKALEEYETAKEACEGKAATCTNETTKYEIVVDNIDTNPNNGDDKEEFTSSQKLNSNNVTGKFPDMVILTDGSCEDGQNDPWNYHNIITFPGTWINNKTGQTVHTMDKGHEAFYTYAGNEYCTKLNSVPINTAWYDWKVNQNGDPSALTDAEKSKIEDSIEMNINGHIDNYGYFGWNFDVGCFYAIGEPETSCPPDDPNYPDCDDPDDSCPPDDPDYPDCDGDDDDEVKTETPINDYDFRSISLDNLFPSSTTPTSSEEKDAIASNLINDIESLRNNGVTQMAETNREIGFNWTCAATNLENPDYLVQPVTTMNRIQALGDSIYNGTEYLDYHIRLTPETMNKVRAYNDKYDSYAEPTSDDSSEVLTAGTNKTSGITVYRSYLLHKVLNSNELLSSGLIGCNNEDNGSCVNVIDTSTACYNEYMAQSAVLKGAN